jgi:hypothetical protein
MHLFRVSLVSAAFLASTAGCAANTAYDSEALRRLVPIVEMDRSAAAAGTPLSLLAVRDEAAKLGMATAVGASRGVEDLSVEIVNGQGAHRVFAVLDTDDCLFGIIDTTTDPATASWLLVENIYTATDVVPSGTCSASAYFGIDLSSTKLSFDPSSPTRLG